ncbi:ABC transporter permease [Dokdonia sp.]|uniref:ABC transporter permease n=1 Tax=Dokdonia sp. TaxID=2024995 RepID=UPI003265AB52
MSQATNSLTGLALQKFRKNFWGVLSLGYIVFCGLIALFAYVIAPDNSQNANQMHLSIHSRSPGFSVTMLTIPSTLEKESFSIGSLFFGKRNNDTEIPITDYTLENDYIMYTPYAGDDIKGISKRLDMEEGVAVSAFAKANISSRKFLLGTDKYGRDLMSRMFVGTRISFSIGFVAVFISLLIGVLMGAVAGYFGGKIDTAIMWVINVTWSIPTLLLVIAITLALGKGFWQVFIAVGLTMWVEVARVVRGQVMGVKQMQYVTAARALGYTDGRIILRHILPNIMAPLIVISAANFAGAILIESGLSFLGIGAQPPMPSWGAMIKDHYSYIILGKPYLAVIPGLAIMLLVMAFMLVGNALRDALDVKS